MIQGSTGANPVENCCAPARVLSAVNYSVFESARSTLASPRIRAKTPPLVNYCRGSAIGRHPQRFYAIDGISPCRTMASARTRVRRQSFRLFKRLHGSTVPVTELGFAICQRMVERYRAVFGRRAAEAGSVALRNSPILARERIAVRLFRPHA
jgi:hypothetical protein